MSNVNFDFDVVCISNHLGSHNVALLKENLGLPINRNYFLPLTFSIGELKGGIFSINSGPEDLLRKDGIAIARKQFVALLREFSNPPKVILLGASLKRLFGEDFQLRVNEFGEMDKNGNTISYMFPHILFTNGDNGTANLFLEEIDRVLEETSITPGNGKVLIVGAGLLGIEAIKHLLEIGLDDKQVIVVSNSPNNHSLKKVLADRNIAIYDRMSDVDIYIDLVLSCTHKDIITSYDIEGIQAHSVIDVAVPSGFPASEYLKCSSVSRYDAGNAFIHNLNFDFEPSLVGLRDNILYGCFTEASLLAMLLSENQHVINNFDIFDLDWFSVNRDSKTVVKYLFQNYRVGISPQHLCFGEEVCHELA